MLFGGNVSKVIHGKKVYVAEQRIRVLARRVRKTFMGKYILRYPIDDEFEGQS
jgi:hypothetical protein